MTDIELIEYYTNNVKKEPPNAFILKMSKDLDIPQQRIFDVINQNGIIDEQILDLYHNNKKNESPKVFIKKMSSTLGVSKEKIISVLEQNGISDNPHQGSNPSNKTAFTPSNQYVTDRLDDNYNPERFRRRNHMEVLMRDSFYKFIKDHLEYSFLVSIDLDKIGVGDCVKCPDGVIRPVMNTDGDTFSVEIDGKIQEIKRHEAEPVDEYIQKLKPDDINIMYTYIRQESKDKFFNEVDFFDIFTNYFKLDSIATYKALSVDIKTILLHKLGEITPVFKNRESPLF